MKKKILMGALVILLSTSMFAANMVTNITVSGLFGTNTEYGTDTETDLSEIGFDISLMYFGMGSDVGFYMNTGYGFFDEIKTKSSGNNTVVIDSKYIKQGMDLSAVLGVAFQKEFSSKVALASGVGLQLNQITLNVNTGYSSMSLINYSLGVGGEVGVKYFITPKFYLSGALNLAFTPINFGSELNGTSVENDATYFSTRIYLGIGFRFAESIF